MNRAFINLAILSECCQRYCNCIECHYRLLVRNLYLESSLALGYCYDFRILSIKKNIILNDDKDNNRRIFDLSILDKLTSSASSFVFSTASLNLLNQLKIDLDIFISTFINHKIKYINFNDLELFKYHSSEIDLDNNLDLRFVLKQINKKINESVAQYHYDKTKDKEFLDHFYVQDKHIVNQVSKSCNKYIDKQIDRDTNLLSINALAIARDRLQFKSAVFESSSFIKDECSAALIAINEGGVRYDEIKIKIFDLKKYLESDSLERLEFLRLFLDPIIATFKSAVFESSSFIRGEHSTALIAINEGGVRYDEIKIKIFDISQLLSQKLILFPPLLNTEEKASSRNIAKPPTHTQSLYKEFFSVLITIEDVIKDNHRQSLIDKNNDYNNALANIDTKTVYKVFDSAYKNHFNPVLEGNDYVDTSIIFPETIIALKIKIFALLKLQQRLISHSSYSLLKKFSSISLQDDFVCERNFIVSINLQNDSTILSLGYTKFDISLYKQDILQYPAERNFDSSIIFKRAFNQTQSLKLLKSSSYKLKDITNIEYLSSIFFSSLLKMKKSPLKTIDISQILIYEDPAIVSTALGKQSVFRVANIYNYNFYHVLTQRPNASLKDKLIDPINTTTIQHLFFNMADNNSSDNYLAPNVSFLPGVIGNYNDSGNGDINSKDSANSFSSLTQRDLLSFSAIFVLAVLYIREKKKNQSTIVTQNGPTVSDSYVKNQVIASEKGIQCDDSSEVKVETETQTDNLEKALDFTVTKLVNLEKDIQCGGGPEGRSEREIRTDDLKKTEKSIDTQTDMNQLSISRSISEYSISDDKYEEQKSEIANLREKISELTSKESELTSKESERNTELKEQLRIKEEQLESERGNVDSLKSQLKNEKSQYYTELKALQDQVYSNQAEISKLKSDNIESKNKLKSQISERDRLISDQTATISVRDKVISDQTTAASSLNEKILKQEICIEDLSSNIVAKDGSIESLRSLSKQQEEQINELNNKAKDNQDLILSQQDNITELKRQLTDQEISINEKDGLILEKINTIKANKEKSEMLLKKRTEIILDKQKSISDLKDISKRKEYLFNQIIEGQGYRINEQYYIISGLGSRLDKVDSEKIELKRILSGLRSALESQERTKISLIKKMRELDSFNKELEAQVSQNRNKIKMHEERVLYLERYNQENLKKIDSMETGREKIVYYLKGASEDDLSDQKKMTLAEELTILKTSPRIDSDEINFDPSRLQICHSPTKNKNHKFENLYGDDESNQDISNYDDEISVFNGSTQDETKILEKIESEGIRSERIIEMMKDVIKKREEKIEELQRDKRVITKQLKNINKQHKYKIKTEVKLATDKLTESLRLKKESLRLKSNENTHIYKQLDEAMYTNSHLKFQLDLLSGKIKDLQIELSKKNILINELEGDLKYEVDEREKIRIDIESIIIEHKKEIDKWKQEVEEVNLEHVESKKYISWLKKNHERIGIESNKKDLIISEMITEFNSYFNEAEEKIERNKNYQRELQEQLESYSKVIMELTSKVKELEEGSRSDYKEIQELASMLEYEKSLKQNQELSIVYTYNSITAVIDRSTNKDEDSEYNSLEVFLQSDKEMGRECKSLNEVVCNASDMYDQYNRLDVNSDQFEIGSQSDYRLFNSRNIKFNSRNIKYKLTENDHRYGSQSLIINSCSKDFFKDCESNTFRLPSFIESYSQDPNTGEVTQGRIDISAARSYGSEASFIPYISTSSQDCVFINAKKVILERFFRINNVESYACEASSMSYISTQKIDPEPFHGYNLNRSRLNKIPFIETSSQDSVSSYAYVNAIDAVPDQVNLERLNIIESNYLINYLGGEKDIGLENADNEENKDQEIGSRELQSIQVDNFRFQIQVQAQERPIASQAKNTFGYLMQTEASKNKSRAPAEYNKKSKAKTLKGEDLDILNEGHSIKSLEVNLRAIPNVKLNINVLSLHKAVAKAQFSDSLTFIDTLSATSKFAPEIKSNCRAEDRIIFTGIQEDGGSCGDISLILASRLQNTKPYKEIGIATVTNGDMNHAILYVISDLQNQRVVSDAIQDEISAYNKFSYPNHQLAIPISKSSYTTGFTKLSDFFAQQTTTNIAGYFERAIDILDINIKKVIYRDDISKFYTIVKNYHGIKGIETIELNVFKNPSAFRKLLFKIHPDKNQNSPSSTADFVFVQELREKINTSISFADIAYSALSKTVFALNIINKSFNAIATLNNPSINNILQSTKDLIDLICADINMPYCLLSNSAASIAIKVYNNDIKEAVTEAVTGVAMNTLLKSILPYGGAPVAMIALTYSLYSLSSNIYNKLYDSPNDYDSVVEASSNPEYFDSAAVTGITMQYAQPDVFVLY